jgi:hypothetical protein
VDVAAASPLPRVTAAATELFSQSVQLYRDENVRVEMSGLPDAVERSEAPGNLRPAAWAARPVGAYQLDKNAFEQARLRIEPNDVKVGGTTVMTLEQEFDAWSAAFYGRLIVEHGQLDTLRLRAPATWAGPFTIDSSVPAQNP